MGGLVTLAKPESVPEGASSRTYDTDYDVGSAGSRAGTTSVYTFASAETVGPNGGGAAAGSAWLNPSNILHDDGSFTSFQIGGSITSQVSSSTAVGSNAGAPGVIWTNPANVNSVSAYATVNLSSNRAGNQNSQKLQAAFSGLVIPSNATILGVQVSFKAYTSGGTPKITPSLSVGTSQSPITLNTTPTVYNVGGNGNLWGYSYWTPASFATLLTQFLATGNTEVFLDSAVLTVYYSSAAPSAGALNVTEFGFNLSSADFLQGIQVAVKGYASVSSQISVQLLQDGVPVGNPLVATLPASNGTVTLGSLTDLWGTSLQFDDTNSTSFGIQISASSSFSLAVVYLDYASITLGISISSNANFNYVGTFTAQNGAIKNIAIDANGNFFVEDVTNNPGVLTLVSGGITPGSYAVGVNGPDVEYLALTDLQTGSDMPLQYTPNWIDRITQVGPGAAPSFSPIVSSADTFAIATITQYPQQSTIRPGSAFGGGYFVAELWSAGPGNTSTGTNVTVYYRQATPNPPTIGSDPDLVAAFNSGIAVNVYITNASFGNGTRAVTSIGYGKPPSSADNAWYFTFEMPTSNYQFAPSFPAGQYQLTVATVTTVVPVPGLTVGNSITCASDSVPAWDNSWQVVGTLNSAQLTITETVVASYVATYSWNVTTGTPPVKGQLVTITGTTNANGLLNGTNLTIVSSTAFGGIVSTSGTAVTWVSGDQFTGLTGSIVINGIAYTIYSVNSATSITLTATAGSQTSVPYNAGTLTSGTMTIASSVANATSAPEDGLATTAGTLFQIDPGIADVGGSSDPILGNSNGGTLTFVGSAAQLIATGTRQGSVFFITRNGYYTAPAPPVTFTIPENTLSLSVSNIPIGPPNVIGRGIILTDAGQNGVPGGNFFTIPTPVTYIVNNVSYTATALIINDNVSTSAVFSFTDSVLLNALAVDVYGYNLFNQIEIGDPVWIASYDSRNWYGKCINKVQNFVNLSFDGGYLSGSTAPLGWTQGDTYGALITSPKFGNAYYISNGSGSTLASAGMISQSAYQDAYKQPIINGNTAYSVRVTCSNPTGNQVGNLVVSLTSGGVTYGSFTLPLASMTTELSIYSGTLLVNTLATVPLGMQLNVSATGLGNTSDVLIDRVDIIPTAIPILATTIFGSYAGLPEQVDAITGQVGVSSENEQPVNGAMVMYDTLYLLKGWGGTNPGSSLYSLQKSSNLEPAQWDEPEVAQRSGGAIGPLAFDLGEQWFLGASREGLYLFVGGQPGKIMQEIYQVWDAINWQYGNTIWVKDDSVRRRLYIGVPLPTPNFWLPNAPSNPNPTSPNVILMCNYQGLDSGEALKMSPQMHTTMFGTLNAIDMRRKWSIWQIPSPFANFVAGENDQEFYICNGKQNSKIYMLDDTNETDDGVPIDSLYTTAGLVELSKRAQTQGIGSGRMRWDYIVAALESAGNIGVTLYPNRLFGPGDPTAGYSAWQLPGGFSPGKPAYNDSGAPLNFAATRTFVEFRENDGHGFTLSNISLHAKADPWNRIGAGKGGVNP